MRIKHLIEQARKTLQIESFDPTGFHPADEWSKNAWAATDTANSTKTSNDHANAASYHEIAAKQHAKATKAAKLLLDHHSDNAQLQQLKIYHAQKATEHEEQDHLHRAKNREAVARERPGTVSDRWVRHGGNPNK